jgi:hypothetical protein
MKHITIGDICVYSEDEDTWEDLIRVVRKANKAYVDSLNLTGQKKREPYTQKLEKWVEKKLF